MLEQNKKMITRHASTGESVCLPTRKKSIWSVTQKANSSMEAVTHVGDYVVMCGNIETTVKSKITSQAHIGNTKNTIQPSQVKYLKCSHISSGNAKEFFTFFQMLQLPCYNVAVAVSFSIIIFHEKIKQLRLLIKIFTYQTSQKTTNCIHFYQQHRVH